MASYVHRKINTVTTARSAVCTKKAKRKEKKRKKTKMKQKKTWAQGTTVESRGNRVAVCWSSPASDYVEKVDQHKVHTKCQTKKGAETKKQGAKNE